jgi:hypothetical protein
MATRFDDLVRERVQREMLARAAFIESDVAEAVALQDFDKIDRLCVVHRLELPPAVASSLVPF